MVRSDRDGSKPVDDPGERVLQEALKYHINQNVNDGIKITQNEADNFRKAFEEPNFRAMMADYISEISDPKNRKEQDQYIRQMEEKNAVPDGKIVVRPQPCFVLKFKYSNCTKKPSKETGADSGSAPSVAPKKKLFVNVVTAKEIAKPSSKPIQRYSGKKKAQEQGKQWYMPYSLGSERMESDNAGNKVQTFDFCVHPEATQHAASTHGFKEMLVQTVKDSVTQKLSSTDDETVNIDEKYHVLKGAGAVYRNNTPPVMLLSQDLVDQKDNDSKQVNNKGGKKTLTSATGERRSRACARTRDSGLKKGFLASQKRPGKKQPLSSSVLRGSIRGGGATDDGKQIPEYTLSEQGTFDISSNTVQVPDEAAAAPPRSLVYRVHLPKLTGPSEVDLDVSEKKLVLKSKREAKGQYVLSCYLTNKVHADRAKAQWDKGTRLLTVTIPIQNSFRVARTSEQGSSKENPKDSLEGAIDESSSSSNIGNSNSKETEEKGDPQNERPDHSRWVEQNENTEVSRHEFAVDGVIPTSDKVRDSEKEEGDGRVGVSDRQPADIVDGTDRTRARRKVEAEEESTAKSCGGDDPRKVGREEFGDTQKDPGNDGDNDRNGAGLRENRLGGGKVETSTVPASTSSDEELGGRESDHRRSGASGKADDTATGREGITSTKDDDDDTDEQGSKNEAVLPDLDSLYLCNDLAFALD